MITLKIKAETSLIPTIITLDTFPCRLGRSLKNNVILDEPSISKEHAIINFDSTGYYIMDLESTNGITDSQNQKVEKLYLNHETIFQIGKLHVEIFFNEESLEKTRIINLASYKRHLPIQFKIKNLLILVLFIALPILEIYLETPLDKKNWGILLLETGLLIGVISFLSAIMSLISKIHIKQYRYKKFLTFFIKWSVILNLLKLYPPFSFSLSTSEIFWKYFNHFIFFLLVFLMLYQLIMLFLTKSNKIKTLLYCFLLTLCLFSPLAIKKYFIQGDNDLFLIDGMLGYPLWALPSKEYPLEAIYKTLDLAIEDLHDLKKTQIEESKKIQ